MQPLFSIIIPTYNRATRLDKTLTSLVTQTCQEFEVLVCDDGSTDNTSEVVSSYKDKLNLKYFWNENWGGPAKPRNIGIQNSTGRWICFLDADDWWYPQKLEMCLPFLNNYDVIYHHLHCYNTEYVVLKKHIKGLKLELPIFNFLFNSVTSIPNSSIVVRKEIITALGWLSEDKNLVAVEDFDLVLRIAQKTEKFHLIDEFLGGYLVGDSNISSDSRRRIKNSQALLEKYVDCFEGKERDSVFVKYAFREAKAHQKLGNYEDAVLLSKQILKKADLYYKIKTLKLLFDCKINRKSDK